MNVFVLWTFQTASKIRDSSKFAAIEHLIEKGTYSDIVLLTVHHFVCIKMWMRMY